VVGDELEVAVWDTEEILPDPSAVDPANARLTVVAANLACARQSTSFDNLDGIARLEQQLPMSTAGNLICGGPYR
jgi:hypothetical protein